jgi:hypothetical protein
MTYYKCKNCNYETNKFHDIKKHIIRTDICTPVFNNYCVNIPMDHKIILSLINHDNNGNQNININELKDYEDKYKSNRKKLIMRLSDKTNKKCCYYCNKNFNKIQELRNHILIECFYYEISNINPNDIPLKNNINNEDILKKDIINNTQIINNDNSQKATIINNNNNNIINNNKIIINIDNPIVSFDKSWDLSGLDTMNDKFHILCSEILYTSLLEKLLENKRNLNVLLDKNNNIGFVYNDKEKTFINMGVNDIINQSMTKLKDNLLEMNNSFKNYKDNIFETLSIKNEEKINKKFIDFQEQFNIKKNVRKLLSEIFNKKTDETMRLFLEKNEKNSKEELIEKN